MNKSTKTKLFVHQVCSGVKSRKHTITFSNKQILELDFYQVAAFKRIIESCNDLSIEPNNFYINELFELFNDQIKYE